jgi:tripartite-type tricarboxylate transporter receptor subunit TctC
VDIIAAANASPCTLAYATFGIGTTPHLSDELVQKIASLKMIHVPYARSPALQDVTSGQVPMMFEGPTVFSYIKSGSVCALAVTSSKRLASLPNVPTMIKSAGIKAE